jgi:tetratricopeptide (TPR) repeat protein
MKQAATMRAANAGYRSAVTAAVLIIVVGVAHPQGADWACGPLQNSFGPFDYRTERGNNLHLVESAHFTPEVEALIKGGSTGYVGGDLDYTLRAYPNHHRALITVMRYGERTKSSQPPGLRYTVDCYFQRAIRFRPDDSLARMLYATYLLKNADQKAASSQLERASEFAGDSAFTHYNIGLIYLDARNYELALREAHKAYGLGFPRQDLKQKLVDAGKWHDAEPAAPASAPAPVSATTGSAEPSPR